MAKLSNEIKTGIVVVVGALLLLLLVYKIGGIKTEKGYEIYALFNYISGLERHAPVRLSGVEVGEVKDIGISYEGNETKIMLTLSLDENAKLRQDSKMRISTLGLLGEKYVEITGGSKGSAFVEPGATFVGIDPFQMEDLVEMGEKLAARLDSSMQDLQKLMGHADSVLVENKDDIRATIMNLRVTSENFKEFTEDIKRHPWKLLMKGKEEKPKEQKK